MKHRLLAAALLTGFVGGLILGVAGCSFQPSLIGEKGVNRLARLVEEKVAQAPTPFIDIKGPPPEKIVDWPELLALAGMMLGGIAHRYYFHRKNGNPKP
jgi:hypothetical protein